VTQGSRWKGERVAQEVRTSDEVTFEAIEESGAESFLRQIRDELVTYTYRRMRARRKEVPKDGGKVRVLSIPSIRDRVVQGAMKLPLQQVFRCVGKSSEERELMIRQWTC
jgi:retron-type reverse transcriptase